MAKCLECIHWKPCFNGKDLDATIATPCEHFTTEPERPNGRWIPVTERLPEPFVLVLVQMPGEKPFKTVREGFISRDGV